jgi:NitT/TauT family transport system substrate-binding protein
MQWLNVVITSLALGLVACDRDSATSASSGQSPGALKEVRVGYFANLTHAQAVLGVASGEFQQAVAPANLTTRVFNAGPSLIEALFAGEIDLGYVGPGPAINAHIKSRGMGIRVIAGAAANGVLIVAGPNSGVSSFADIKGKRIATPQLGNTQDVAARHFLTAVLKQEDHKNVLPVANAEQASLMARGEIDVAWAPEPWGSRLLIENGAKLVAEEKDLWPNKAFTLTLVVTTPEFLKKHPEVVEKVLVVHRNWAKRLQDEPQQQLPQLQQALTALTGKALPAGVLPAAIGKVQFTDDPLNETLETMATWSAELGFVKEQAKLDGLVDLSILNKLRSAAPTAGGK